MTARLAISIEVDPGRNTPGEAIQAVQEALEVYGRVSDGTTTPWGGQAQAPRGLIFGTNTRGGSSTIGTWRLVERETRPEEIAAAVVARLTEGRTLPGEDTAGVLAIITRVAAEAIREDRKTAANIVPDDDF
ncbi:MAG: hypothetical protein K0S70_75 [Microbacterium sp.]|jgi:hypothetical protein|nr:hypothetical protein [Microbacterium sp.]